MIVAGGFGLLGSWVTHALVSKGRTVAVLDQGASHADYLEPFRDQIFAYHGEATDIRSVFEVFAEHWDHVQGVIHVPRSSSARPPYATVHATVMGLTNLIEAARLHRVPKVVFRSSSAVYGDRKGVLSESMPARPIDSYGAAMAAAEMVGIQFAREAGILLRIVRTSQIYGAGRVPRPGSLFAPLAGRLLIDLPAGWADRRDLTCVKDAAKGVVLAFDAASTHYQVFNISGGVLYTMEDIVEAIKEHSDGPVRVKIGQAVSNPRFAGAGPLDLSRAREVLKYRPDYDLNRGIEDYVQWLKTRSAVPVAVEAD